MHMNVPGVEHAGVYILFLQMQIYNIAANTWSSMFLPSNTSGKIFGGSMNAVHVNGVIYFCGGVDSSDRCTTNACGTYTIATKTFGAMASMPNAVNHAAHATDGTKIYIVGGR